VAAWGGGVGSAALFIGILFFSPKAGWWDRALLVERQAGRQHRQRIRASKPRQKGFSQDGCFFFFLSFFLVRRSLYGAIRFVALRLFGGKVFVGSRDGSPRNCWYGMIAISKLGVYFVQCG